MRIGGGLSREHLDLILADAHQLLAEVGLEIDHPALLKELSDHPGVTVRANRVCYEPQLVEKARAQVAAQDTNYACGRPGDEAFLMVTPFSPFEVLDFETGRRRPACDRDVSEGARLYDAFGATGPVHVHIGEMDQRIAQMHIAKLCCENSRTIGNWSPAFTYEQAICIRDMYLAAGRPEPHVAFQMTHSPLRLDAYFLDILMRARGSANGVKGLTAGGGALPLPGVSAPIYWRSAVAQGLAEALGGWVTAKLIHLDIRPYASFLVWAPDLVTCKWTPSTPEAVSFALYNNQAVRELLGLCHYADCGNLYLMCMHAFNGSRRFACGGQRQECFSPAHIPIDQEKINFVRAATRGMDMPMEKGLTTRIVKETFPQTSFLVHESSLEFRSLFWHPQVFEGMLPARLGELLMADSDELLPHAREIARKRLAQHPFDLPADVQREVNRIYESGVRQALK
jgi:hypothetical protein